MKEPVLILTAVPIPDYMIEYTNSPCSDNAWLVATNPNKVFKRNKILVSDLDNDKIYHFRLTIANSAGTSLPSFATEPVRLYCPGHKEAGYSRNHNFTDQRIKVIKHLRDLKFPMHDTFQLECQIVGYPVDQIKWIRDGKEIHEKSGKYNFIEKGPEQIVLVVSDADKYDEGRYMVTIKNDLGLASSTCHVKYIEPPIVIHAPKNDIATLKQGCGGRIKIYVDGTPPFKYEVYKAGQPILERSDITADLQSKPSLIKLPRSFSSSSSFDSDGTTDDIKVRAECSMDSSGIGTDISNPLNKNLFDSFTSTGENDDSCSSKSTNSSIVDYKLRGASARLQNFNKPIDGCNDILDKIFNNNKHSMDSEYTYVPKYARYKLIKSVDNVCLLISGVELSDCGDYNFEISNSSGIISKTISVKVLGAPSAPQGPVMSEIIKRSSEILASWSKPQNDGGSEITHYEIEKKEIGKSNWENCVDWTKDSNCTLRNFVPNIKYKIRVCAVNEHGKGPYLECDNALWIPLDITLPGPPTNLIVADVIYEYDSRKNSGYVNQLQKTDTTKQQSVETIELRWHEPFQKGGNGNSTFLGYLVERFDELHNKWITVNGHENNLDRIYSYKYRPSRDMNGVGSSRRTYSTRSSGLDEKLFPFLTKSESLRLGNIRSDMDYMFRVFSVNEVGKSLKAAECLKKSTKNNFDYACGGEGLIEIITSLKNLTIYEGKTLRLETCIKAPLHSVIRWYKDNFELCTSLKYNIINVGTRHLLLVHDFNEHDQGNYDCVCVHLLNRVSTSATICLKERKLEEYYLDQKVLERNFVSNNNKYSDDETNVNDTRMSLSTPYQSLSSLVESTSSNTLTDTETTISEELPGIINNSKIKSKISQSSADADSYDSKSSISQTNRQAEDDSFESKLKDNNDNNNNQTPNNKNNCNQQQSNGDQKIVESSSNLISPTNRSTGTSPSLSITSTTLSSHTSENEVSISKNEGFAPIFTQVLPEIEVDDDESAILTCKVKGNPKPSIEWFKGNEKIIESDQSFETLTDDDGSCVLSIHAVEPYMDDTYVCLATNCYGSASTSSHLKVTSVQLKLAADALMTGNRRKFSDSDLSRPEIFNRSKDVSVPRGQTVTLECFVQGTPKPDVTWLFQDIPIIAENVDMFSEDDLYKLTIYDIEPSNSGVYTCVCTNIIGRDSCDITLTCK